MRSPSAIEPASRAALFLLLILFQPFVATAAATTAGEQEAVRWMVRVQDLLRSRTSIAVYTMQVITPQWQRTIRFKAWDDRPGKRFFIRILAPRKDAGTAWLKLGGNLWMYLPKLERDIRIPPSMMLSSWMGSDFTNDDLVKAASVVNDYTHRIAARGDRSVTIVSMPKPDAAVVWGKLVHVIRRDGIPLSESFYDEHGRLRRRLVFKDVRQMGGRRIPTRWEMTPLDRPGRRTVLTLQAITFDPPIPDTIFTRANLKRPFRGRR